MVQETAQPGTAVATRLPEDEEMGLLVIDPARIQIVKHNVELMERVVSTLLTEHIDYGTVPGIKEPFLFDPGACTVRDIFSCYPEHEVMLKETENGLMTIFMRANLISRKTKEIIASGVGAATMQETKHKYRWVEDPTAWGYKAEDCLKRKSKYAPYDTTYRILNPDVDELKNTILKMASKRAEVDASQNLPGVARAMKKIKLGWKLQVGDDTSPEWDRFWGATKQMGLTRDKVHLICKVKSMTEWVDGGKTLEDAIKLCQDTKVKASAKKAVDDTFGDGGSEPGMSVPAKKVVEAYEEAKPVDELPPVEDEPVEAEFTEEELPETKPQPQPSKPTKKKEAEPEQKVIEVDTSKIKNSGNFYKACFDFFKIQPPEALKLAGYSSQSDLFDCGEAFQQVAGALGYTVTKP